MQPGDLCVVTGAFACKGNIGREVTLERYVAPGESVFHCDGYFDAGPEGLWLVGGEKLERNTEDGIIISDIAAHIPAHLMPIRRRPAEVEQHQPCVTA